VPLTTWQTLPISLRRAWAGRGRRVNPVRDWTISVLVMASGLGIGLTCLPDRPARAPSAVTLVDAAAPGAERGAAFAPAVFALRDDGVVVRFAGLETDASGALRVGFYDPLDPLLEHATEPVSLPADARLLWLLAAPGERQAIRDRTGALVTAIATDTRAILTSQEFRTLYRDRFQAVFQDAARAAWSETRDSDAWRDLMRGMEPTVREILTREVRPVLERRFRGVPAQMLRANALAMIDPFTDRVWNMRPVEDALRASLLELRDRGVAERAVAHLLDSPLATTAAAIFQDALVRALTHDDRLASLVMEMAFDARLRPHAELSAARAHDLARTAPRLLVSLHGGRELNLVAATVIRATMAGRGDRVVVFMNPAQRAAMTVLDPAAVRPMDRAPRS